MSREGPVPLSSDLERFLEAVGIPQVSLLVRLNRAWPEIAGPLLAGKAVPLKFRNGILTVGVPNHSWAQEIRLATPVLLARVRDALGPGSPVTDLRFVVGAPESAEPKVGPPRPEPAAEAKPGPDPEGLASVSDERTRESLRAIHRRAQAAEDSPSEGHS